MTEAIRINLHQRGYCPIPVIGKHPALLEWQKKTETSRVEIRLWDRVYPDASNTGALTRGTPVIDIDIMDPEAAQAIEELVRERFDTGFILVRVGQAPKRAVIFRTNQPFKKRKVEFTAPNGMAHKIEILGDGQQVVVAGIHPDTTRPYTSARRRAVERQRKRSALHRCAVCGGVSVGRGQAASRALRLQAAAEQAERRQ